MILLLWFNINKFEQLRHLFCVVALLYYCYHQYFGCYCNTFRMQLLLIGSNHYKFQVGGNLTVGGIDYFLTDAFGEGLYESCKEVKFGTMNSRALQFIGGGAQNFKG